MLSKTHLPHKTALTIELNLSSMMTMSDASLATSVPHRPMLSPTSAALRAGASLVPSPVTPTTSPLLYFFFHSSLYPGRMESFFWSQDSPGASLHSCWFLGSALPLRRVTRVCLSSGDDLARTWRFGRTLSSSSGVMLRNSGLREQCRHHEEFRTFRDCFCGVNVISRDHPHGNAGALAHGNRP